MFRGAVLGSRPTQKNIDALPFRCDRTSVSGKCRDAGSTDAPRNKDVSASQCTCQCCCFVFEIKSYDEALKVPLTLWGRSVTWRKIANPIGLDQSLPAHYDKGQLSGSEASNNVPSRIPIFRNASCREEGKISKKSTKEYCVDLRNGLIKEVERSLTDKKRSTAAEPRIPKVAIMGSGGIGCEILKTLFLRGFHDFTVIDRDTIDVSNLNRQLLFSSIDVGRSKATVSIEVLREALKRSAFYKSICAREDSARLQEFADRLRGLHGNIETFYAWENQLPPFSLFSEDSHGIHPAMSEDLCFSALDNIPTRQYVNRLCYATNTPIIESGVSGLNGQVQPICVACGNQCYDCLGVKSAEARNTFAVCTIHARPTSLVHCVHYAQELYAFLMELREKRTVGSERNEFDELYTCLSGIFAEKSDQVQLCKTAQALFDFMCSDRILRKFSEGGDAGEESEVQQESSRKRSRTKDRTEGDCTERKEPMPISFQKFVEKLQGEDTGEDYAWDSSFHQKIAFLLFIHSLISFTSPRKSDIGNLSPKRTKANFIFAVAYFRCLVFNIPIELQGRSGRNSVEKLTEESAAFCVELAHNVSMNGFFLQKDKMREFISFFFYSYVYPRDPLYTHVESVSMRIIPSLSSANAIVSAFAVSMGIRSLGHEHLDGCSMFSNGLRIPSSAEREKKSRHYCSGEYMRHIHARAAPMQVKNRNMADLSVLGKVNNVLRETPAHKHGGTRRQNLLKLTIYSNPIYKANPSCVTCTDHQCPTGSDKHPRFFSTLADCSRLTVGQFVLRIAKGFFGIADPNIDMSLSSPFLTEKQFRTLYEHEEFETNEKVQFSRWMGTSRFPFLTLVVSSAAGTSSKKTAILFHDSDGRLPSECVLIR